MAASPRPQVGVTVTVVFGVGAVVLDAAGTLLNPGSRAAPVAVALVSSPHPPGEGDPVWEQRPQWCRQLTFAAPPSLIPKFYLEC